MHITAPHHLWRKQRRRRTTVLGAFLLIAGYIAFARISIFHIANNETEQTQQPPERPADIPRSVWELVDHTSVCGPSLPSVYEELGAHNGHTFVSNVTSDWVEGLPTSCSRRAPKPTSPLSSINELSDATQKRFRLCYHKQNRFLFFGNNWGRHSNQLTSLAAALVIGKSLRRTIIVPPFFPDHSGKKQNSAAGSLEIVDLYNISMLLDVERSPFCVLSEQEFLELERERKNDQSIVPSANSVPALCITMRGIKTFPRQPKGFHFECKREVFVKYKKDLDLFMRVANSDTDLDKDAPSPSQSYTPRNARVLTVPLMIYYTPKVTLSSILCVWRLLQPHPVVADVINVFRSEFVDKSGSDTFEGPKRLVIGAHMRSLEGSCDSRIDELEQHALKQAKEMGKERSASEEAPDDQVIDDSAMRSKRRVALKAQCLMESSYILSIHQGRPSDGITTPVEEMSSKSIVVFVADDNQGPDKVAALVSQLSSSTVGKSEVLAYRLRDVFSTATSPSSSMVKLLKAVLANHWVIHNTSFEIMRNLGHPPPSSVLSLDSLLDTKECDETHRRNAKERQIIRNRFHVFNELLFMQLDFWALAGADIFVGNQLSTLSLNVCRLRLSAGLACDNFVGADGFN